MSFEQELIDIEDIFTAGWTVASVLRTPIAHENESYDPRSVDEWVRIMVQGGDGKTASISDKLMYRYRGVFFCQIFVKSNIGTARALELADFVTPIFRSKRIGNLNFGVPAVTRIGTSDAWYQVNVDVGFYREEFES